MANQQEFQAEIEKLQAAVDAEQVQIADMKAALEAAADASAAVVVAQQQQIADLEAVIADLRAQLEAGATPEQLQAAIEALAAIKADIESTVPDTPADPEVPSEA